MRGKQWSHRNRWLNEFETVFVRDTRDWVRQLTIETDVDALAICGRVNSFFAAQLAIQAVKEFGRRRPPFAAIRLSLDVDGYPLDLNFVHEHAARVARPHLARARERRSELTAT